MTKTYSDPFERESNDKHFFAGGENRVFTLRSEIRYKLDLYLGFASTVSSNGNKPKILIECQTLQKPNILFSYLKNAA